MLNEFTKKEAPIQGLAGLGGGVPSRLLTLASGTTTYIDDVFSTFLYEGTGSAQTINNGIDLDGEGDECDYDDGIGIEELEIVTPKLIKMIDLLGREQTEHKEGLLLFYIYNNGKIEKKFNP